MTQITKGPRPIEDVAIGYGVDLYHRLRCERGWRADVFELLRREYGRFAQSAIAKEFGVLSMWEYGWLVEATHQYLRYKDSKPFSAWFHRKVCKDLNAIGMLLKKLPLDEQEKASMRLAYKRMAPIIKMWEATE